MSLAAALSGSVVVGTGAALAASSDRLVKAGQAQATSVVSRSPQLVSDLAAANCTIEQYLAAMAKRLLLIGAITTIFIVGLSAIGIPPLLLVPVALGALAVGGALKRKQLAKSARAAHKELNEAAVSIAEIMSLALAGHLGLEAGYALALSRLDSAAVGRLRGLEAAGSPWIALESFGQAVGADRIVDLARVLGISATQRARSRETLLAWAETERSASLAQAESKAANSTEAMEVAIAFATFGLIFFIVVPAVITLLGIQLTTP